MITFFRQIRQSLLSQNKTGKYVKYAVGEIVLVVIGILIALQINNWNIDRIERKNEHLILLDLQVEFMENLKDAERVFKGNTGIYNAMTALQENMSKERYHQRTTDSLMYYVFDWFDYTPKPGASDNLINSGNLHLIRNKELRKLLTLWSGVNEELDDDEALAIRYSQDVIIPYISERYPIGNLEEFDGFDVINKLKDQKQIQFNSSAKQEFDVASLLNDKTFKSHVSAKKIYASHNVMEGIPVINTCRSILSLIEEELDQNNNKQ